MSCFFLIYSSPAHSDLSTRESNIEKGLVEQQAKMERTLKQWVDINTGTWNAQGLKNYSGILRAQLKKLGFTVEVRPGIKLDQPGTGDAVTGPILIARRAAKYQDEGARRLLLSGHMDTVFETSSSFQKYKQDKETPYLATGPGVIDMKGGMVVMMYALEALNNENLLDRANWVVVLNSDEEVGSLGSRAVIEGEARNADYGFVFEGGRKGGAMVGSRRGLGQFHLSVEGVAAHAGSSHSEGRSAVRELAKKILEVEALTNYKKGLTLNTGTFQGGTKRNIIPEYAEAWIDVRFDSAAEGARAKEALQKIADKVHIKGTKTTLWGLLHRPPKEETASVTALLKRHAQAAEDLGIQHGGTIHSGGGTDGSLMGAVGLTNLDSMGPIGGRAHTDKEFIVLETLSQRARVAAVLLSRIILEPAKN